MSLVFERDHNATHGVIHRYINGVQYDDLTMPNPTGTLTGSHLYFGAGRSGSEFFSGKLDDIRIYNRALSTAEVTSLYDTEKPSLTDGLVAYYPFNGNANDESGNANNGVVNGATSTTDRHGIAGKAYSFDGVNDNIDLGDKPAFDFGTSDFTFSLWFQTSGEQINKYIIGKYHGVNPPAYGIGTHGHTKGYAFLYDGGESVSVEARGSTDVDEGNWHHMLVAFDRDAKMSMYLDGALEVSSDISGEQEAISNAMNLYIGRIQDGAVHFGGKIDDIRIYNRALTAAEVLKLYDLEKP